MSIMWKYLDKRAAVVEVLRDFSSMRSIIENTDAEVQQRYGSLTGLRSVNMDGMPKAHNPQASEETIVNGIEEIDILKQRYMDAVEYMDWFLPAWNELSEEDQYVLDVFYRLGDCSMTHAADLISEHYAIERTSAYNRKNRALSRLTLKLYGKR